MKIRFDAQSVVEITTGYIPIIAQIVELMCGKSIDANVVISGKKEKDFVPNVVPRENMLRIKLR